ncbi:carboxypeptidase Y-deficient [Coemansia aciculifera]|nr:carboxypeptidase Y-deficient [Coemansia aciculifera]
MHLDEMHFAEESGMKRVGGGANEARRDDLDDVKGAILGFFRGASKALSGGVADEENRMRRPATTPIMAVQQRRENSGGGVVRSLTAGFMHQRRAAVSAARLEDNRVERRIERLTHALSSTSLSSDKSSSKSRQACEQRVVAWEADDARDACPLCARQFGRLAVRRHHCRVCGRLVCGTCTRQLAIAGAAAGDCELRVCGDCSRTVARIGTRHEMRSAAAGERSLLETYYAEIRAGMADADGMLPRFNAMLARVRSGEGGGELARAAAVRRKLTAAFSCSDRASKAIAALPADSPSATRLHAAIRRAVVQYLQTHMFTLSMLPTPSSNPSSGAASLPATPPPISSSGSRETSIDQPPIQIAATPAPAAAAAAAAVNSTSFATSLLSYVIPLRPTHPPAAIGQESDMSLDGLVARAMAADPQKQAALLDMSREEKLASLEVLRDQRQRVLGYIAEAQKERRLEDAMSLQASLSDLDVELSIIERHL